jgi:hypothetical protein
VERRRSATLISETNNEFLPFFRLDVTDCLVVYDFSLMNLCGFTIYLDPSVQLVENRRSAGWSVSRISGSARREERSKAA